MSLFPNLSYRGPVEALRLIVEFMALPARAPPELACCALLPDRLRSVAEGAARREVRIVRSAVLRLLAGENPASVSMVVVQAFA